MILDCKCHAVIYNGNVFTEHTIALWFTHTLTNLTTLTRKQKKYTDK